MHQALRRASEQLAELDDTLERTGGLNEPKPYEEVRDFFHYIDNYVHELDLSAEKLPAGWPVPPVIPALTDHNRWAHSRHPIDMMRPV